MIHYFNPGHETAVMNGSKYYMAPANVVNMQSDLDFLPAYYSNNNDFIYLQKRLPENFALFIRDNLQINPISFTIEDLLEIKNLLIGQDVDLWGISPQSVHKFQEISDEHGLELSIPQWDPRYKDLNDRHTARKCLEYIIKNSSVFSDNLTPQFFTSIDEIENYITSNKETRFLAKAPYSSSGRGLLWLPIEGLTRPERQILHGHIKKQGSVSIEKVLDKKLDFAMEFYINNGQALFKGYSLFQTNNKGAYISNYLGSQKEIEGKILNHLNSDLLEDTKSRLIDFFNKDIATYYKGYVGVDMMIYEENDSLLLHPCIEINARYNMGLLAIEISKRIIKEDSEGYFFIDFSAKESEIFDQNKEMTKSYPLILSDNKIESGYLSLCPILATTKYRAYILIERK